MPKKFVGLRLEEDLLSLKPQNVSFSDWIRECIYVWKQTKEGEIEKLLEEYEKLAKRVETLRKCPDLEKLSEVLKRINKLSDEFFTLVMQLRTSLGVLENLEDLTKEVRNFKSRIEESLVYQKPGYERENDSYGYGDYGDWEDV